MASLLPAGGALTRRQAAHLLRRTTFGPTREQIDGFTGRTAAAAIALLLEEEPLPIAPHNPNTNLPLIEPERGMVSLHEGLGDVSPDNVIRTWWVSTMALSGPTLKEKVVFFMHTYFTNMLSKNRDLTASYYQFALFRHYAFGDLKELTKKICIDNAMLRFLDGRLNVRGRPQENFARELFELYTVGKGPQVGDGDYTTFNEDDVREAARVLSGWTDDLSFQTIDPDTGIPVGTLRTDNTGTVAREHDAGEKIFSAAFGNRVIAPAETLANGLATVEATEQELDDFIGMIFEQRATAEHFCRRLYRFFVYYKISDEVERDIIQPLANTLIESGFQMRTVLERLLASQHFYDQDDAILRNDINGALIKSPVELVTGVLRFFKVTLPEPATAANKVLENYVPVVRHIGRQGLNLIEPFEEAGYAAYHQFPVFNRNWISANYLAERYSFIDYLLAPADMMEAGMSEKLFLDTIAYVDNPAHISDPTDPEVLVRELVAYLLPEELPQERIEYFMKDVLLDTLSVINWRFEWQNYKNTGDDTAVRLQINALIRAILQSPEYQLQ